MSVSPVLAVFVTFKHQMGRHNQKRHGWRYGRNPSTPGTQTFDEVASQALRMSRRSGRSVEMGDVNAARRIVAARHSMRSTPEASERAVYRKRSDLPHEIARGIPRPPRPAAAATPTRPPTYEHITSEGRTVRVSVPGSSSPAPRAAAPRPKPAALPEVTAPPASSSSADAFRRYWSGQGASIDLRDSELILEAAKTGGIANISGFIKKTFTYKDEETGLHTEIDNIDSSGSSYSHGRKQDMITVSGKIRDQDGNRVGEFVRSLNTRTMDMHHNLFEIDEAHQGGGFGSRFYQHTERAYIKAKVKSVSLFANLSVGGYAWARMGFDFASKSTYAILHDNAIMAWKRAYGKPYLGPMLKTSWDIAALKGPDGRAIGKETLLGTSWDGVKNLTRGSTSRYVGDAYYRSKATKGKTPKG